MGQAGSSQQALHPENGLTLRGNLDLDEDIARQLQDEEDDKVALTKWTANDEHDLQLAQQLQEEEDRRYNRAQADAVQDRELQIARDAELAFYMEANNGLLPPEFEAHGEDGTFTWRSVHHSQHDEEAIAESLVQVTPRDHGHRGGLIACVACGDQKQPREVLQAPCGDYYCGDCLEQLFRISMTDERYFPPRCHTQEIRIAQVKGLIDPEVANTFEARYVELSTANKTYCHDARCSTFIPPSAIIGDVGRCSQCNKSTCTFCKGNTHRGDCPEDIAVQQLNETADRRGWKRCQRCNRMIELTHGCNHMTCVCGHEFCYVCGRGPWKSCNCNDFDLRRLLHHAREIVHEGRDVQNEIDQQAGNAPIRPGLHPALTNQELQNRINLVRQQLIANHEDCEHPKPWSRYQQGEHECWICHRRKGNKVVGWCRRCYFVACYPCRRTAMNRMR